MEEENRVVSRSLLVDLREISKASLMTVEGSGWANELLGSDPRDGGGEIVISYRLLSQSRNRRFFVSINHTTTFM